MKCLFLTFMFAFFCIASIAQKTKTFPVAKTQLADISGLVRYDLSGKAIDTSYVFLGRDSRYTQIINFIGIRHSSLLDIYYFLRECRDLVKTEEVGVSDYRGENRLLIGKLMGMKYINIYGINDDTSGYTQFASSQIANVLTGIEYFAKNHKIELE